MDSDGEEIQFELMVSDQSSQFNRPHFDNFEGQQFEQYFNNDQDHIYKQQPPTALISDEPYQPDNSEQIPSTLNSKSNQGLFKCKTSRKKKFIEVLRRTKQKYVVCKKGNKRETSLLNINFKTFLSSLLREYLVFNNASQYEKQKIKVFFNSKANFISFQKLYGVEEQLLQKQQQGSNEKTTQVTISQSHDNLRRFLLQKFENGSFIRKIMVNKKMSYETKVSMIKFCSRIRKSCISPQIFSNWKAFGLF